MKDGTKAIKQTKVINSDGTFWVKEEQIIQRYNERGFLYRNRSSYLKKFMDKPYPKELSYTDKGQLSDLEYEVNADQLLVYKSHNTIKPHTATTIAQLLDVKERRVYQLLKKCKQLGVIGEVKIDGEKYYMLNPIYKLYGNRISLTTFLVFQEQLMRELPQWAIDTFINDSKELSTNVEVIN